MPARYPRIQHEASLRVFALDMLDSPENAVRSLEALLEEVDGLEDLLESSPCVASRSRFGHGGYGEQ